MVGQLAAKSPACPAIPLLTRWKTVLSDNEAGRPQHVIRIRQLPAAPKDGRRALLTDAATAAGDTESDLADALKTSHPTNVARLSRP